MGDIGRQVAHFEVLPAGLTIPQPDPVPVPARADARPDPRSAEFRVAHRMAQFSGCEPLVGEIVGLRTFRVDESGLLLPLYAKEAWYDGTNTAVCAPPTGERPRPTIRSPRPTASAASTPTAPSAPPPATGTCASSRPWCPAGAAWWPARRACARSTRASTPSGSAQPCRRGLRARIAQRYPSARIYADKAAMLAEHPLSVLPCYESPPRARALSLAVSGRARRRDAGARPAAVVARRRCRCATSGWAPPCSPARSPCGCSSGRTAAGTSRPPSSSPA